MLRAWPSLAAAARQSQVIICTTGKLHAFYMEIHHSHEILFIEKASINLKQNVECYPSM
jgi:hypothetical protein